MEWFLVTWGIWPAWWAWIFTWIILLVPSQTLWASCQNWDFCEYYFPLENFAKIWTKYVGSMYALNKLHVKPRRSMDPHLISMFTLQSTSWYRFITFFFLFLIIDLPILVLSLNILLFWNVSVRIAVLIITACRVQFLCHWSISPHCKCCK